MKAPQKPIENQTTEELLQQLEGALEENKTKLEEKDRKLKELEEKYQTVISELLLLRKKLFGSSSERFISEDPHQLKLKFEEQESIPEETLYPKEEQIQIPAHTRVKKKPVRVPITDHLRREDVVIEPDNIPEGAVRIGEEITEKLEYNPGEIFVRRIIRPKYALKGGEGILIAQLPEQVLDRSNAGSSLLAHLIVSKYVDHLPFYRQIEIFKRQDVHLPASTVNDWFKNTCSLLRLLYEALRKEVLSSDYLQIDESTIPVVDKDKPGATRKGYHWIVKSPDQNQLFFHYQKGSRAQKVVVDLLRNFNGAVQSDGYGAYTIYEKKANVLLLGCWAHARRKFMESLTNDKQRATYALEQIRQLYEIERKAREEQWSFEQIKKERIEKAYPLLRQFELWLAYESKYVTPTSSIGKAISYTLTIYPRLCRYVLDGRYNIDNNGVENGVRPLALGRRNYMFCGNDEAAEMAAIAYSLLGSCRLANVNPQEWLTDVLNQIQGHSIQKLTELLPSHWRKNSI
jgi:transposase